MRVAWSVVVGATLLGILAGPSTGRASAQQASLDAARAAPEIRVGVEERFRLETWDNVADHDAATDDHRKQWRFRTRAWAAVRFGEHVSLGVSLNNESKGQDYPRKPLALDEIIFESLWVDLAPAPQVSMRVGRQSIQKGDGFILTDGTPADGSRTLYVNAVDAAWRIAPRVSLEAIVLSQPSTDEYLPVIHSSDRPLIEWDEQLAGLYYTDTRMQGLDLQGYFFRKWERDDTRPLTHPQHQPDRAFNLAGARVARSTASGWTLTGELAGEFGTQVPGRPIRAWAGYANVRRQWRARWSPTVLAGYTAMSGDAPETSKVEGWDPVLARWPKWSEFYINSLVPEVGASYWTNMGLWQLEATLVPTRRTGFRATYYHLTAFQPFDGPPEVFSSGLQRGDLFEGRFDFTTGPAFKGHVMYERFLPGSFYTGHSPGYFFRVELTVGWQKAWGAGG